MLSVVTCFDLYPLYRVSLPDFYAHDPQLPIYQRLPMGIKRVYGIEDIVRILLNPRLSSLGVLCTKVPTSIAVNAAFVVDVTKLEHKDDLLSDDMGVWKNNRVPNLQYPSHWSAEFQVQ